MNKYKIFFILNALLNILLFKAFAKPESDIPSGTGYEIPCYTSTLDIPNVDSYFLGKTKIETTTRIANNTIIAAKCKNKYYVFNSERKKDSPPQNAFNLTCINGGFKKSKASEFCDERCNIADLPKLYFKTSTDILLPGEKTMVQCPPNQITASGPSFEIQCGTNGLLVANAPLCFPKDKACDFNGKKFPEGAKLSCADETGLVFVVCEKTVWQQDSMYKNATFRNTCKETIGEVEFKYQDLNELSINTLPNTIKVEDFEDFCKANPKDPGCNASLKPCSHKKKKYDFGTGIILKCPGYENAELQFQCIETWSFIKFMDPKNSLARTTFGNYDTCSPDEAELINIIPPKSKEKASNKTLEEKKIESWKEYKDGIKEGTN